MYTRRQKTTRKENKLKHGNEICTVAKVFGERKKRRVETKCTREDKGQGKKRGGGGGRGETEPTVIPPPGLRRGNEDHPKGK